MHALSPHEESPRRPFGLPSLVEGLSNERKFVGDALLAPEAERMLAAICLPDGEHPEGKIRSVYFDSPRLEAYAEKANGDNLKQKVRLRWYEEEAAPDDADIPVWLEIKAREGAARRKVRHRALAPACQLRHAPLDGPFFQELLARLAHEGNLPVPLGWLPVVRLGYRRTRWLCPFTGTRVALDRDVAATGFHPLLFPAAGPIRLPISLVEYKNAGGAPPPGPKPFSAWAIACAVTPSSQPASTTSETDSRP